MYGHDSTVYAANYTLPDTNKYNAYICLCTQSLCVPCASCYITRCGSYHMWIFIYDMFVFNILKVKELGEIHMCTYLQYNSVYISILLLYVCVRTHMMSGMCASVCI